MQVPSDLSCGCITFTISVILSRGITLCHPPPPPSNARYESQKTCTRVGGQPPFLGVEDFVSPHWFVKYHSSSDLSIENCPKVKKWQFKNSNTVNDIHDMPILKGRSGEKLLGTRTICQHCFGNNRAVKAGSIIWS